MIEFIYALLSVIIVSLLSLVGVFTLFINEAKLKKFLLYFVAFAAGTLLSAAFLHLIPESIEHIGTDALIYILAGILLFFIIESFIHWHHCLKNKCSVYSKKSMGIMNLFGDAVHNFIDGVMIAAAYLINIPLGISATIAIIAHEIPQELGDFAVLLHSGFTKKKALLYNLLSALTAVLGMIAGFFFLQSFESYIPYVLAVGAGGFIYIAMADLFPEINKNRDFKKLIMQTISVIIGILLIFTIISALPHEHAHEDHSHEDSEYEEQIHEELSSKNSILFSSFKDSRLFFSV